MTDLEQEEPRRHTYLQEEARMMSPVYRATEETGNDWRSYSLCHDWVNDGLLSPDAFFAVDTSDAAAAAVDVCFDCPVRTQCLRWACTSKARYGIFGGLPASIRRQQIAGPNRGRPHDYPALAELSNPYDTSDEHSRFFRDELTAWDGEEAE